MIAVSSGRPSSVLPISTTVIRSDSLVELLQVLDVLRVVDETIVVADVLAELLFRRCDFRRGGFLRLRRGRREEQCQGDGRLGVGHVRPRGKMNVRAMVARINPARPCK